MSKNPFEAIDRQVFADSGASAAVTENLLTLCDEIGPRFAGTDGYRRAAEFMLARFGQYQLEKAALEPFEFTAWRRGASAELSMEAPFTRPYDCYALPYGAATKSDAVEAEALHIGAGTETDVEAHREKIAGRLVLATCAGVHRQEVYAACAAAGAAGLILCCTMPGGVLASGSVTDAVGGAIPAVCIGHETGLQIQRLAKHCRPRLRLVTHGALEQATTWNVVGELTGTEFPDELVIIGGHLDSHEIGPGAFDNAAGAVLVMETARLLARQRRHLKRTIRFIGFGAEEVGLLGSHHHAARHAVQLRQARFMLNCDTPSLGRPRGLAFHQCPKAEAYLEMLSEQMETSIVCQSRKHRYSDHYPFVLQGLPTAGVAGGPFGPARNAFGHMAADTPDKISLTDLRDAAAFAARILLRAANDDQWPEMRRSEAEIESWRGA